MANKVQRLVIGFNIQHFLQIAKGVLTAETEEPLCFLVQDTAGVGEIFIITSLNRYCVKIKSKLVVTI